MKLLIAGLLILNANAFAVGFIVRGGGDTDVIDFLDLGYQFTEILSDDSTDISVSAEAARKTLQELESSLNGAEKAKLRFTTAPLFDGNGVEKLAVYDRTEGSIVVQRNLWAKLNPPSRYRLVNIEILGLSGSDERYTEALRVSKQMHQDSVIVLPEVIEAVGLCSRLVSSRARSACSGVSSAGEAKAVAHCSRNVGIGANDLCTNVKSNAEAEALSTCARGVARLSVAACRGVKTSIQAEQVIQCIRNAGTTHPEICKLFNGN